MQGPNRGKKSIGIALETPEGRALLDELIAQSDVFVTNFLPGPRSRLKIDVEDIRKTNPDIIYVRGSGFGNKGPEREKGGYDSTGFWARGGSLAGLVAQGAPDTLNMPTGAYGDSMGGMTIAGGIAAALYARKTTGETSVLDVSLLSVGAWATQYGSNLANIIGGPLPLPPVQKYGSPTNPLTGTYRTSDDRLIMLTMLQPGRYWSEFVKNAGRPELAVDPRFDSAEHIMTNAIEGGEIVAEIIRSKSYAEWLEILGKGEGQWAAVQDFWEVSQDVSLRANGYIAKVLDIDGNERELVANPVQFDETPAELTRAPEFAEHTDEIVLGLGKTEEELIALKIAGAIT
jgi:crotonobetainyl-CoA:carnitine CoA-transferase CaiB-like acyl-CoA transferase